MKVVQSSVILVASATGKFPETRRNAAETPMSENPIKIDISSEKQSTLIDRRLSVAPMIDWTDKPRKYGPK